MHKLLTLASTAMLLTFNNITASHAQMNTATACLAALNVGHAYVFVDAEQNTRDAGTVEAILEAHVNAKEAWGRQHQALGGTNTELFNSIRLAWSNVPATLELSLWCFENMPKEQGS